MTDAWGGAWGASWGSSWGYSLAATYLPFHPYAAPSRGLSATARATTSTIYTTASASLSIRGPSVMPWQGLAMTFLPGLSAEGTRLTAGASASMSVRSLTAGRLTASKTSTTTASGQSVTAG